MPPRDNTIVAGMRVGKWLIVGETPPRLDRNGKPKRQVTARCECGIVKTVLLSTIRCGESLSCGCGKWSNEDNPALKSIWSRYLNRAEERKLQVEITVEQAKEIFQRRCFYCGAEPFAIARRRGKSFKYNGIDRYNNDIGYTPSNCVPCCKVCNCAKSSLSPKVFHDWIKSVYRGYVLQGDNFTMSMALTLAWRDGIKNGVNASLGVLHVIRNRADQRDGNWIPVIEELMAKNPVKLEYPDSRDPQFQQMLVAVDAIYDGSKTDRLTSGATDYIDHSTGSPNTLEEGASAERIAQIGQMTFYRRSFDNANA